MKKYTFSRLSPLNKLLRFLLHLSIAIILGLFYPAFSRKRKISVLRNWSKSLLRILNIQLHVHNPVQAEILSGIIIANHRSWLDIIALNAVTPSCFIAKTEVRSWPVLGWLCQRTGTQFIDRADVLETIRLNRQVADKVSAGERMAFFPEGTSSTNNKPGHFHSPLFQGAIDSQSTIQPVAIWYHDTEGHSVQAANFVGDMSFIHSLWRILRAPSLHVTLAFLPALPASGQNRRQLAKATHAAISQSLSDMPLRQCAPSQNEPSLPPTPASFIAR
jgi:1-acyl-sn-glycerol-3-phosphate acyltransferase